MIEDETIYKTTTNIYNMCVCVYIIYIVFHNRYFKFLAIYFHRALLIPEQNPYCILYSPMK